MKKKVVWILLMVYLIGCTACRPKAEEELWTESVRWYKIERTEVETTAPRENEATTVPSATQTVPQPQLTAASAPQLPPEADDGLYYKGEREMDSRILLYHHFTETAPSEKKYSVISTPQRLEENIVYLLEHGYTIIPLQALLEYHNGTRQLPPKTVVLTMDDGYESNYTLAYPILQKYQVHATIFVVASAMDEGNKMTWEQMREMERSGLVDIQSHSMTHTDHSLLDGATVAAAVKDSFAVLEANLGKRAYRMFAYPYGRHTEETVAAVQAQGVDLQLTTQWRALDINDLQPDRLPRLTVSYHSDMATLLQSKP